MAVPHPTTLRALRSGLRALADRADPAARVPQDPVRYLHRYRETADVELAAAIASSLAFGRVASFAPVLDELFDRLDQRGGPAAALDDLGVHDTSLTAGLSYRWVRSADLHELLLGLADVRREHGALAPVFQGATVKEALQAGVGAIRGAIERRRGPFDARPRGVKHALPLPSSGSACKRWNMALRWLVRPPTEGVDRGVWSQLSPAQLVVPLDTHVHRIARLVGLTERATAGWRTAEDITDTLRLVDADDPVRFDFALAHLGISGLCTSTWRASCGDCPLVGACALNPAQRRRRARRGRKSS